MKDPRTFVRVLWCETASLAVVLTGDVAWWVAVPVLALIPVFGLASPTAPRRLVMLGVSACTYIV